MAWWEVLCCALKGLGQREAPMFSILSLHAVSRGHSVPLGSVWVCDVHVESVAHHFWWL